MSGPVSGGGPVRVGFLGAGWLARRATGPAVHAATNAVLHSVAARDLGRAGALEPTSRVHDRYADLLADPQVELVYVNLDNAGHEPWVLAALRAGKHVLCEKPLSMDAATTGRLHAAAAQADRLLVEAFWWRWHPRTRRLQALLAEQALGAPTQVEARFCTVADFTGENAGNYRLDPARGGGALLDLGCYAASAGHLALGPAELELTQAQVELGPTGVDLRFEAGGPRVRLAGSFVGPDAQQVQVTTEHGALSAGGPGDEAFTSYRAASTLRITGSDGTVHEERFAPVDAYQLMVEQVAGCVREGGAPLVDVAHSLAVAGTLDAVRRRWRPSAAP